jgi:hypothetical protein
MVGGGSQASQIAFGTLFPYPDNQQPGGAAPIENCVITGVCSTGSPLDRKKKGCRTNSRGRFPRLNLSTNRHSSRAGNNTPGQRQTEPARMDRLGCQRRT